MTQRSEEMRELAADLRTMFTDRELEILKEEIDSWLKTHSWPSAKVLLEDAEEDVICAVDCQRSPETRPPRGG